ncbi:hypothetical protein DNU06_15245 [Putridiphycobacter roseus]|uniref:Outer membrane protein beta-barrel domain-containing protein n=1 Tax=Putridiphycobacter roseus TaxID=2219161 RepID=A0A2W1MZH4_9FLAO|nr:outer membrane beta-barrel protein [Putridiphycobacter roseus]PZE16001.1 hypothetical protein DNU06_15245 [Putridiphycobacter roseus]
MIKSIITTACILVASLVYSQSSKISGHLMNTDKESIVGASVMLIGAQDSILKTYSVTNKDGVFHLNHVKAGEYLIKASFFGYQPFEKNINVLENASDLNLGDLTLIAKILDEVVVSGHYLPIQIKGDTVEYDSRAFEVKEHQVVEDLLKQLPGVEIEEDGTIKVQGKTVESVLVDGEKFFGSDVTIATKNLPANAVAKVQVFDKKSDMSQFTGVDDGSESPTINLKLKEDHKKGYFGNIELSGGSQVPNNQTLRHKTKGNVHYFHKKWQLSVIGMSNNVNETGFTFSDYSNFKSGMSGISRSNSGINVNGGDVENGFLNTNATGFNFNYTPTKQTTLASSFFFNNFNNEYNETVDRETYFNDSTVYTNEITTQNNISYNNRGSISLKQKFDSTHFFNIDLDGAWSNTDYLTKNYTGNLSNDQNIVSAFNTDLGQNTLSYEYSGDINYRKKFIKPGRFTGFGLAYDYTNNDQKTGLEYLNTLYNSGVPISFLTNQKQISIQETSAIEGNFVWSEPLTTNQLLEFNVDYLLENESRDKKVYDLTDGLEKINDLLTATGAYTKATSDFAVAHKYISSTMKTTIEAKYEMLNLSGAEIFSTPKVYQYVLPKATINWDVNKKSNLRLQYKTATNAPTLNQLQPLLDNTNPSQVVLGNINLEPEYEHSLNLRYRTFNQFNFTFFMANLTGSYTQNNIVYAQNLNADYVQEIIPENFGTERSISSFLVYGSSLHAIKTKFHFGNTASISNGLINLNNVRDEYTTYLLSPSINIENIGKKTWDLRGGFAYNYSLNRYKDNASFNNNFQNYNYYGDITYNIKDRWVINGKAKHYFYPDFTTNKQQLIVDFSIGLNLLESRKLQVFVSGNDLLNQNTGLSQSYTQNIYEQQTTLTLGRYGLVGLKYAFERLGGAKN